MFVDFLEQLFQREFLDTELLKILVIWMRKTHIVLNVTNQVSDEIAHDDIGIIKFRFHGLRVRKGLALHLRQER